MRKLLEYSKYVVVPGSWAFVGLAIADTIQNPAGIWDVFTIGVASLASIGITHLAFSGKW